MVLLRPEWSVAALTLVVLTALVSVLLSQEGRRRWCLPMSLGGGALAVVALMWARPAVSMHTSGNPIAIAVDVSASMGAEDVGSTRLQATQQALHTWLGSMPANQQVSLTSFCGTVVQLAPLLPAAEVDKVVDNLALCPSTAVGDGLKAAAQTLGKPGRVTQGSVVLISDGTTNVGVLGNQAAKDLLGDGVLVHAIGIGTKQGTIGIDKTAHPVPVDHSEMKAIATANGTTFQATKSADELVSALQSTDTTRIWRTLMIG